MLLLLHDLLRDLPRGYRSYAAGGSAGDRHASAAAPPERFLLLLPASVAAWSALSSTWGGASFVPSLYKQVRLGGV